jgi:hypothetical protein
MSTPSIKTIESDLGPYIEHDRRADEPEMEESVRELKKKLVAADNAYGRDKSDKVDEALEYANEILHAHGVEAIRGGGGEGGYYGSIVALYVNMGDTYAGTLLYDVDKERFYITSWGNWVEAEERAGRAIPNRGKKMKSNPLRKGYSRAVISDNISTMVREGYAQDQAVAAALSSARKSYRSRHPRGRYPAHLKDTRAHRNPEVEAGHVYGQLGDINPLDYSGGVVYQSGYGEPVLEYTHGLEGIEGVGPYDEDVEDVELEVYRVSIEEDVLEDLSWVDWKSVASYIDMPVSELKEHAKSGNVMARASVYEAVGSYEGWHELDSEPLRIKYSKLDKTWFPGGRLAKKMRVYEPNASGYYEEHPHEWVSTTYGVMPSKKVFEDHFEKELGDDGLYRIRLSGSDSRAADGTIIGDGQYDDDELYKGVKQLVKKFERGDDAAGDLASSILYTLGFEWI